MGARSSICARWWGGSFKRPTPDRVFPKGEPLERQTLADRINDRIAVESMKWMRDLKRWLLDGVWPGEPVQKPVGITGPSTPRR